MGVWVYGCMGVWVYGRMGRGETENSWMRRYKAYIGGFAHHMRDMQAKDCMTYDIPRSMQLYDGLVAVVHFRLLVQDVFLEPER
jgi:hypothetical protein